MRNAAPSLVLVVILAMGAGAVMETPASSASPPGRGAVRSGVDTPPLPPGVDMSSVDRVVHRAVRGLQRVLVGNLQEWVESAAQDGMFRRHAGVLEELMRPDLEEAAQATRAMKLEEEESGADSMPATVRLGTVRNVVNQLERDYWDLRAATGHGGLGSRGRPIFSTATNGTLSLTEIENPLQGIMGFIDKVKAMMPSAAMVQDLLKLPTCLIEQVLVIYNRVLTENNCDVETLGRIGVSMRAEFVPGQDFGMRSPADLCVKLGAVQQAVNEVVGIIDNGVDLGLSCMPPDTMAQLKKLKKQAAAGLGERMETAKREEAALRHGDVGPTGNSTSDNDGSRADVAAVKLDEKAAGGGAGMTAEDPAAAKEEEAAVREVERGASVPTDAKTKELNAKKDQGPFDLIKSYVLKVLSQFDRMFASFSEGLQHCEASYANLKIRTVINFRPLLGDVTIEDSHALCAFVKGMTIMITGLGDLVSDFPFLDKIPLIADLWKELEENVVSPLVSIPAKITDVLPKKELDENGNQICSVGDHRMDMSYLERVRVEMHFRIDVTVSSIQLPTLDFTVGNAGDMCVMVSMIDGFIAGGFDAVDAAAGAVGDVASESTDGPATESLLEVESQSEDVRIRVRTDRGRGGSQNLRAAPLVGARGDEEGWKQYLLNLLQDPVENDGGATPEEGAGQADGGASVTTTNEDVPGPAAGGGGGDDSSGSRPGMTMKGIPAGGIHVSNTNIYFGLPKQGAAGVASSGGISTGAWRNDVQTPVVSGGTGGEQRLKTMNVEGSAGSDHGDGIRGVEGSTGSDDSGVSRDAPPPAGITVKDTNIVIGIVKDVARVPMNLFGLVLKSIERGSRDCEAILFNPVTNQAFNQDLDIGYAIPNIYIPPGQGAVAYPSFLFSRAFSVNVKDVHTVCGFGLSIQHAIHQLTTGEELSDNDNAVMHAARANREIGDNIQKAKSVVEQGDEGILDAASHMALHNETGSGKSGGGLSVVAALNDTSEVADNSDDVTGGMSGNAAAASSGEAGESTDGGIGSKSDDKTAGKTSSDGIGSKSDDETDGKTSSDATGSKSDEKTAGKTSSDGIGSKSDEKTAGKTSSDGIGSKSDGKTAGKTSSDGTGLKSDDETAGKTSSDGTGLKSDDETAGKTSGNVTAEHGSGARTKNETQPATEKDIVPVLREMSKVLSELEGHLGAVTMLEEDEDEVSTHSAPAGDAEVGAIDASAAVIAAMQNNIEAIREAIHLRESDAAAEVEGVEDIPWMSNQFKHHPWTSGPHDTEPSAQELMGMIVLQPDLHEALSHTKDPKLDFKDLLKKMIDAVLKLVPLAKTLEEFTKVPNCFLGIITETINDVVEMASGDGAVDADGNESQIGVCKPDLETPLENIGHFKMDASVLFGGMMGFTVPSIKEMCFDLMVIMSAMRKVEDMITKGPKAIEDCFPPVPDLKIPTGTQMALVETAERRPGVPGNKRGGATLDESVGTQDGENPTDASGGQASAAGGDGRGGDGAAHGGGRAGNAGELAEEAAGEAMKMMEEVKKLMKKISQPAMFLVDVLKTFDGEMEFCQTKLNTGIALGVELMPVLGRMHTHDSRTSCALARSAVALASDRKIFDRIFNVFAFLRAIPGLPEALNLLGVLQEMIGMTKVVFDALPDAGEGGHCEMDGRVFENLEEVALALKFTLKLKVGGIRLPILKISTSTAKDFCFLGMMLEKFVVSAPDVARRVTDFIEGLLSDHNPIFKGVAKTIGFNPGGVIGGLLSKVRGIAHKVTGVDVIAGAFRPIIDAVKDLNFDLPKLILGEIVAIYADIVQGVDSGSADCKYFHELMPALGADSAAPLAVGFVFPPEPGITVPSIPVDNIWVYSGVKLPAFTIPSINVGPLIHIDTHDSQTLCSIAFAMRYTLDLIAKRGFSVATAVVETEEARGIINGPSGLFGM